MNKNIFYLLVFQIVFQFAFAQKNENKYQFHSVNSLAFINGNNSVSAGLQTVNGFEKKHWFAGIGVGLDYYLYRTVPLFADTRYSFGNKKNKLFGFADAGFNFSWVQSGYNGNIYYIMEGNQAFKYKNGVYTDLGFGYSIKMKKNNALVLSLSQSHKSLVEAFTFSDWRTNQPQTNLNTYKLNRVIIKIGWKF